MEFESAGYEGGAGGVRAVDSILLSGRMCGKEPLELISWLLFLVLIANSTNASSEMRSNKTL